MQPTLKRPNTVRFNTRHLNSEVTPEEVYLAINKELGTVATVKCIARLDNKWFNVSFDNEKHCEKVALSGIILKKVLLQCERANVLNSTVVYVKAPYEMADNVVTTALSYYGTVTNIRRQVHDFDEAIETGVRSLLIKNLMRPIPSFLKIGGFTLPVRHRGQQKTCKICNEPDHFARDCPNRGRCFVCGSNQHRASLHDEEDDTQQQRPIFMPTRKQNNRDESDEDTQSEDSNNDNISADEDDEDNKDQTEEETNDTSQNTVEPLNDKTKPSEEKVQHQKQMGESSKSTMPPSQKEQ